MAISFVGSSSVVSGDNNTSYQITKPAGVQEGDFLLAVIAHYPGNGQGQVTVTPPTGWTIDSDVFQSSSFQPVQLTVMTRTVGPGEPSSWAGTYSGTQFLEVQLCAAYRGVTGLESSDTANIGNATSYTVGPTENTSNSNWRVTIGTYCSSSASFQIDSNEVTERRISTSTGTDGGNSRAVECGIWDSDGTVTVGDHSRTVSRGATWGASCAWIGILDASDAAIPADLAVTLPDLSMAAAGDVSHHMILDVELPQLAMTAAAIASPPEGPLSVVITPVVHVGAAVNPKGPLEVLIAPSMDAVGETRKFGIRVVVVPDESRVVTPHRGAVD